MKMAMANEAVTTAASALATGGGGVFFGLSYFELLGTIFSVFIVAFFGWMAYSVHKGNKSSDQSVALGKLMGLVEGLDGKVEEVKTDLKVVDDKVDRLAAELKESIIVVDGKVGEVTTELKAVDGKLEKSMTDSAAVHSEIKGNIGALGGKVEVVRTEVNGNITAAENRLREDIQNLRADNRATNKKIDAILLAKSGVNPIED